MFIIQPSVISISRGQSYSHILRTPSSGTNRYGYLCAFQLCLPGSPRFLSKSLVNALLKTPLSLGCVGCVMATHAEKKTVTPGFLQVIFQPQATIGWRFWGANPPTNISLHIRREFSEGIWVPVKRPQFMWLKHTTNLWIVFPMNKYQNGHGLTNYISYIPQIQDLYYIWLYMYIISVLSYPSYVTVVSVISPSYSISVI